MECTYTSKNGQLTFRFEYAGPKDLFLQRSIAEMHDEDVCGCCKCPNIRCEVRTTKEGHTYYEMRCQNLGCNARLDIGQNKDMKNLFVKRSEHPDTNGWYIYRGEDEREEHPQPGKFPTPTAPPTAPTAQTNGPKTPVPTKTGATGFASPPMNGSTGELLTYQLAKADCARAGISEDDLKAWLKQRGQTKWNNIVCTPLVREMIEAKLSEHDAGKPTNGNGAGPAKIPEEWLKKVHKNISIAEANALLAECAKWPDKANRIEGARRLIECVAPYAVYDQAKKTFVGKSELPAAQPGDEDGEIPY